MPNVIIYISLVFTENGRGWQCMRIDESLLNNKKLDIKMRRASVSHFTTACFDHIFRHMESIWTTHENLLISNLIFVRKEKIQDDTSQRKRKIARMWDRDPFEIFEEKHVEAERFAIASVFTSSPDRYFARKSRNICRCSWNLPSCF